MLEPTTEFGKFLLHLINKRRIGGGASGLAFVIHEYDPEYTISAGAISHYIAGRSGASVKFALKLSEALKLTQEEREELAWAFVFGQKEN